MKNDTQIVTLQSILESSLWQNSSAKLPLAIGKDENGKVIIADLTRLPHLLISGVTGSGKSVCINSIILSLLNKFSPDNLHLILADLKIVEFAGYKYLPHLQLPIANNNGDTLNALQWCVTEIDRRYHVMKNAKSREIHQYNDSGYQKMPYIVFILNELSDLMLQNPEEADAAENAISNICSRGRAAGVHLIVSTSRADGKVLPFNIRANIPAHIAFRLYSADSSCIMLGHPGGEKLKGFGDMLMQLPSENTLLRCQGAYADYEMLKDFIDLLTPHKEKEINPLDLPIENIESEPEEIKKFICPDDTQGFLEALKFIISNNKASASLLQRHLHIGYNRAAEYINLWQERVLKFKKR